MRKLIAWNLMSLDGHFEGSRPWDLDFHQSVWGDELEAISFDQLADMDMLLFGRKTYDGMKAHWEGATGAIADAMNGACPSGLHRAAWRLHGAIQWSWIPMS